MNATGVSFASRPHREGRRVLEAGRQRRIEVLAQALRDLDDAQLQRLEDGAELLELVVGRGATTAKRRTARWTTPPRASMMAVLQVSPPPEAEPMSRLDTPPAHGCGRSPSRSPRSPRSRSAPPRPPAAEPELRATIVQRNLVHPWDIAFAPDGRMFVTERPGRIRVFASGAANAPIRRTFTDPERPRRG